MTLQAVSKYGAGKAQIAENQKTVIDWEHWEAAIDDPVVGELKGVYEQLLKEAEAKIKAMNYGLAYGLSAFGLGVGAGFLAFCLAMTLSHGVLLLLSCAPPLERSSG